MVFARTYSGDYLVEEQGFEVDESDYVRRGRPLLGRQLSLTMPKKSPRRRNIFRTRSGSQTRRSGSLTERSGSRTRRSEKNKKQDSGRKMGKPNRRRLLSLPSLMDDKDRTMVIRNTSAWELDRDLQKAEERKVKIVDFEVGSNCLSCSCQCWGGSATEGMFSDSNDDDSTISTYHS